MSEVQVRTVLWYFVFVGFAINYMMRINANITIVEMIATNTEFKMLPMLPNNIDIVNQSNARMEKKSLEKHFLDWIKVEYNSEGFHWNEYQQGLVLGSFYWAHWLTQIPGGILAKKYGTKLVFGLTNAVGCWLCFLMPISSYWDYRVLIFLRVLQGLVTGMAWPAMQVLTAQWIPPNERSKFVTAYLGSSVGIALFYPLFGYIMDWSSWELVYHVCGMIGTIWWMGWIFFVYDRPAMHPRISPIELRHIEKSLGSSIQIANNDDVIPWRNILTSRPVWMNVIAQWGGIWSIFTLMTQAPTYFKVIHNWNIKATGVLSGLPHLMRLIFAYGFSIFADYLLSTEKMSRTNLRKLATAVCCIVKGVFVIALAYFGHNAIAAIILLTVATMFHGAVSSGPLASIVDISPNYAGIVQGITGVIGSLPGFISPYFVGLLTLGNQSFTAWKHVFLICAAMLLGCGFIYIIFAESTLQPWNAIAVPESVEKEMETLYEPKTATEPQKGSLKKEPNVCV